VGSFSVCSSFFLKARSLRSLTLEEIAEKAVRVDVVMSPLTTTPLDVRRAEEMSPLAIRSFVVRVSEIVPVAEVMEGVLIEVEAVMVEVEMSLLLIMSFAEIESVMVADFELIEIEAVIVEDEMVSVAVTSLAVMRPVTSTFPNFPPSVAVIVLAVTDSVAVRELFQPLCLF